MAKSRLLLSAIAFTGLLIASSADAAAIFLTGHDPDFHAFLGGNTTGARDINNIAISFVEDPAFNPFVAGGITKFLFVESSISPPAGHVNGVNGIIASGYTAGVDFEHHDASDLNTELNLLGTKYAAIVVASDFGGVLTSAELNILNARSADIIDFLNAGGGIYAMAESDSQAHLTDGSTLFGYLPFVVASTQLNQSEVGITLSAFGTGLGLTTADVNGNASHNVFNGTFGLNVVDWDSTGNILSLAGRGTVSGGGVDAPEPASAMLLLGGLAGLVMRRRKR